MITWPELVDLRPDLAGAGRALFYQWELGLGFLATVRKDGGPRVHPICPVITERGCFGLHSETCPPPRHDDAFYVTGHAVEHRDRALWETVAEQFLAERKLETPWPGFDEQALVEFTFDRCLLTLTEADDAFPKGHTVWTAP